MYKYVFTVNEHAFVVFKTTKQLSLPLSLHDSRVLRVH